MATFYVDSASFSKVDITTLTVTNTVASTASWANNAVTASYVAGTASWATNAITSSYASSGPFASLVANTFTGNQTITGSLTITQNLTVLGSSSITYLTASQLAVSQSYISVNVFEPAQRFGGLYVYDSGSSAATASLTWDSLNNKWIYNNASGSTYSGGGLMSGPRNTGSLGQETFPTQYKVLRSQGGDHLYDSNITDNDTKVSIALSTDITGSLNVTAGITGSLLGSASYVTTLRASGSAFSVQYNNGSNNLAGVSNLQYNGTNLTLINGKILQSDGSTYYTYIGSYQGVNENGIWSYDSFADNSYPIASYFIDTNKYYYGGNNIVYNNANNRLGIGTATPSTTLHVVGTVSASSYTGDGSALTGVVANTNQGQVIAIAQANYTI